MKVLFENLQKKVIIDSTKNLKDFMKINHIIYDFPSNESLKFPNDKFGLFCFNEGYLVYPVYQTKSARRFILLKTFYVRDNLFITLSEKIILVDYNKNLTKERINSAYFYCLTKVKEFTKLKNIDSEKVFNFQIKIKQQRSLK